MLISILHRQVQHTCTLTPTCNRCIHSHKATCHHTDTTCECKELAEEYFMKKMYEIQIIVQLNLLEHELKDLFCVYVCVWVYVCLSCVCSAHGSPKMSWNWMEWQVFVSCLMWALGTEFKASVRAASALNCWAIALAPAYSLPGVAFHHSRTMSESMSPSTYCLLSDL